MHDPQTKLDERQSSQGPEMLQQLQKQLQNNPICFLKQIEDTNGKGESIYMIWAYTYAHFAKMVLIDLDIFLTYCLSNSLKKKKKINELFVFQS